MHRSLGELCCVCSCIAGPLFATFKHLESPRIDHTEVLTRRTISKRRRWLLMHSTADANGVTQYNSSVRAFEPATGRIEVVEASKRTNLGLQSSELFKAQCKAYTATCNCCLLFLDTSQYLTGSGRSRPLCPVSIAF